MSVKAFPVALFGGFLLLQGLTGLPAPTSAQSVTQKQMEALVPTERNLHGFIHARPAREIEATNKSLPPVALRHRAVSAALKDDIRLNVDLSTLEFDPRPGTVSTMERVLYAGDGMYRLRIVVRLCDSRETALQEKQRTRQYSTVVVTPGTFSGASRIGEESTVFDTGTSRGISFQYGRLLAYISGSCAFAAAKEGLPPSFPPAVIEAVAHTILLRASRQNITPADAAAPPQNPTVVVNGKPLPPDAALLVDDNVYVPVVALARTAGLASTWNPETGQLTLGRTAQQVITLTAGTRTVSRGDKSSEALRTPVLKEGDQPVMTLEDLLPLIQAQVTKQGTTYQVRIQHGS